jgi:hypothetical protein
VSYVPAPQPVKSVPAVVQPVQVPIVIAAAGAPGIVEPGNVKKDEEKETKREEEILKREAAEAGLKKKIDELSMDNLELVEAIKEYHEALELIMGKHRTLMVCHLCSLSFWKEGSLLTICCLLQGNLQNERQMIYEETRSAMAVEARRNQQLQIENVQLKNKISEMLAVMRRAVSAEGSEADQEEEVINNSKIKNK